MAKSLSTGPSGSPSADAAAADHDGRLAGRAIHGFFWMLSNSASQVVVQLVTLTVLARLLGPTAFGVVGGALVIMRVADVLSKLGVGQALVQREHVEPRHVAAALCFFLGWGALVTAVLVATAPLQADLLRIPELRQIIPLMAAGVLISNASEVSLALLRRELRFRVIAIAQAAAYAVAYGVVGVGLAVLGFGLWSLVWAFLAQYAVTSAALLVAGRHPWSVRSGPAAVLDLLTFGGGMTAWRLAISSAQEIDNLVVARTLGTEALGLYRRAYQLSVTPAALLGRSISTIVFPVASRLREPERLARAYLLAIAGTMLFGLPIGAFIGVVAPEIVAVLLGPQWTAVAAPLAILSLGFIFQLNQQIVGSIAAATGAVYQTAWRHGVLAVAVLVGALIGQWWGLVGVATGVLAALAFNYALMSRLALEITGVGWRAMLAAHLPAFRTTAVVAGSAWLARWAASHGLLDPTPFILLLICTATTTVTTLLAIRLWPEPMLGSEGLWWAERVLRTLPSRPARKLGGWLGIAPTPRVGGAA